MKRLLNNHTKMSMDDHRNMGKYLSGLSHEFQHLNLLLYNNGYRLHGAVGKVERGLSLLRSELEECMAQDHPEEWDTSVYYGSSDYKEDAQHIEDISGLTDPYQRKNVSQNH